MQTNSQLILGGPEVNCTEQRKIRAAKQQLSENSKSEMHSHLIQESGNQMEYFKAIIVMHNVYYFQKYLSSCIPH